jgi:hypothetical protein
MNRGYFTGEKLVHYTAPGRKLCKKQAKRKSRSEAKKRIASDTIHLTD